ncbi:MAG: hypothetical protein MJE66_01825 [Proteobacteria bacterium]|nr:hypothetical protein [Pseudomonadota bacterium]
MTARVALLGSLLLVACTTGAGPREQLLGRWQSDREATLAKLENHPTLTEAQRSLFEEILGELVVEYTNDSVTSSLEGWCDTRPYEVVGEGPDYVDLRGRDLVTEETIKRRVWVKGDRMWIWIDHLRFHEYFVRLP